MRNKFILVFLALVVVASGCTSTSSDSSNDSSGSNLGNPADIAESYSNEITGFSEDLETAYQYLSADTKEETDYPAYDTEITNLKSSFTSQGVSLELLQAETLERGNGTANVELTYQMELVTGGATNTEATVDLVAENGEWKIDEVFNPYSVT